MTHVCLGSMVSEQFMSEGWELRPSSEVDCLVLVGLFQCVYVLSGFYLLLVGDL